MIKQNKKRLCWESYGQDEKKEGNIQFAKADIQQPRAAKVGGDWETVAGRGSNAMPEFSQAAQTLPTIYIKQ